MKDCVFNHNIITLTLPRSLLYLWRFYYPVLAVNYYHLRVFVKEAVLLISTHIFWKHLGTWGWKFLLFQNNAASSSWGADPAPPQGEGAADGIVSLSTVFSKHSLPANFWGHFSLKVSALPASCLFVSPAKERQSKKIFNVRSQVSRRWRLLGCSCSTCDAASLCRAGSGSSCHSAGTGTLLWRVSRRGTSARWCPTCPASAGQCRRVCWAWSLQSSLLIVAYQHPAPPQISCNCVLPAACLADASLLLLLGVP